MGWIWTLIQGLLPNYIANLLPSSSMLAILLVAWSFAAAYLIKWCWGAAKLGYRSLNVMVPIALVGFSLVGLLVGIVLLFNNYPDRAQNTHAPFIVEFPGNEDIRPNDPFVRPLNIGIAGDNIDNFISSENIRFKLSNANKTTARNVEVFATRVAGTPVKIALLRVSSGKNELRPDEADYYQLVEFYNPKWGNPIGGVKHVSKAELDGIAWRIRPNWMTAGMPFGVFIPNEEKAQYVEDRPVSTHVVNIDVEIYADDLPVTFARFALSDPEKIKIKLVAQGLSLPSPATEMVHEEKK